MTVLFALTLSVLAAELPDKKLEKLADARMREVATRVAEVALQGVFLIPVFPGADEARQAVERLRLEAQRFAHLARGGAPAIGDDVGGHGRAQFAVPFVDVLDDALAPVARRQVQVDVGPLAALFGKETLEEQLHSYGIDRRDSERSQMFHRGRMRESRVSSAHVVRNLRMAFREAFDVDFVDHRLMPRRSRVAIISPDEIGIDDDRLRHERRAVDLVF